MSNEKQQWSNNAKSTIDAMSDDSFYSFLDDCNPLSEAAKSIRSLTDKQFTALHLASVYAGSQIEAEMIRHLDEETLSLFNELPRKELAEVLKNNFR